MDSLYGLVSKLESNHLITEVLLIMEYLEYPEEITVKFCKSKTKFLDQKVEYLRLSKPLKKVMISQEINWLTILCLTNSWQDS